MKKLLLFSTIALWNLKANAQCTPYSSGPKNPTAATQMGATPTCNSNNPVGWTGITNIYSADGIYSYCGTASTPKRSYYLLAQGFGFSIPTTDRITGIQVDVKWYTDGGANQCGIKLFDNTLGLIGTDHSTGSSLPGSNSYSTFGSQFDIWGTTLTATDINKTTFGVAIGINVSSNDVYIDHIRMTVFVDPRPYLTNPVITNVSCNGGNNGSASVTASGGISPYTFSWTTAPVQTSSTATGLSAGTYTVIVADANGCTNGGTTATVTQPTAITTTVSSTNVNCNGGNNGSATVTANGGTPAYTYLWSSGQTTSSASGLSFGNYTITVTDSKGCTKTGTVSITQPTAITVTTTVTNASCSSSNGTASVVASGGTPSYTYSWSNGQSTTTATGLSAGSYTITVTDNKGCTKTGVANISNTGSPTITVTSTTSVTCNGGNNGSASISASGGVSPYTYLWCNGQTTTNATGLSATCNITVTDAVGCASVTSVNISQPSALTSTISATSPTCNSGNDGSASVNVSGATPPYTYLWNASATTQNISGLIAGNYSVTITDANGCTKTSTITVTQPNPVSVNITPASPSICNGSSVTLSAGFGYSSYSWSTGQTIVSIIVSPTTTSSYSIIVSDVNGCTGSTSTTVTVKPVPPTPTVFINGNTTFCQGDSVQLVAPVGYSSYVWSPGGKTTTSIDVNSAGNYIVTVTNSQGCTASSTPTNVTVNALPSATLSVTAPICGNNNGSITASVGNGNPPYTFSWNTGETTATVTGLTGSPTQTLIVTVTDSNNCSSQATALVTCATGINNYDSQNQISIFPNPSNGLFTIQSSDRISNIEISNLIGEKIYFSQINLDKTEIDLSKEPTGIYFIKVNSEKGTVTKKIIIQ